MLNKIKTPREAAMTLLAFFVRCPPREATLPLWATALMHITIAALPVARLYRFCISLQRCHLSDLLHCFSVYIRATCQTLFHWFQFTDFIALVSVYSRTTGQTLFHWFQLAVLTLVKLYFMV